MSNRLTQKPSFVPAERESTRQIKAITEDAKLICAGVRELLHEFGPVIEELDALLWKAKGLFVTFILLLHSLVVLVLVLLLRHG